MLVSGSETAGRYCLIAMVAPRGGWPAPHRHDFEKLFILIEGELEFTSRDGNPHGRRADQRRDTGQRATRIPEPVDRTVHMLGLCAPAGQEEFFAAIGDPLDRSDTPSPFLNAAAAAEKAALIRRLAPAVRTEFLEYGRYRPHSLWPTSALKPVDVDALRPMRVESGYMFSLGIL